MYIIKMRVEDKDKKSIEWNLQGFDKRPLRLPDYALAHREAMYQKDKHSHIDGFSCSVVEAKLS